MPWLRMAAPRRHSPPPRRIVDEDRPINPKVLGTAQDAQLNAALDLLGAPRAGR